MLGKNNVISWLFNAIAILIQLTVHIATGRDESIHLDD